MLGGHGGQSKDVNAGEGVGLTDKMRTLLTLGIEGMEKSGLCFCVV